VREGKRLRISRHITHEGIEAKPTPIVSFLKCHVNVLVNVNVLVPEKLRFLFRARLPSRAGEHRVLPRFSRVISGTSY
jgi:hypothetical protein